MQHAFINVPENLSTTLPADVAVLCLRICVYKQLSLVQRRLLDVGFRQSGSLSQDAVSSALTSTVFTSTLQSPPATEVQNSTCGAGEVYEQSYFGTPRRVSLK